jgi:alkylation response protein AidB-like acyl-CoA dehydrogenase
MITLTPAEVEVRERARKFVEEVLRPLEPSWATDDYDVDQDVLMGVMHKFGESGLRGVAVPEEVGGLGLGSVAKSLVAEELMSSRIAHGSLATWTGQMEPSGALFSAPEWQKERYLYPIFKEDKLFHLHISEPGTGSDAAGITTTAVRDGDSWVINGVKRWAPPPSHPAVTPDYLLCYAVTDPSKGAAGISSFLVDYPNPGVSVTNIRQTMAKSFLGKACDYVYQDCVVPAENLLGEEGKGFSYLMGQLNRNRVMIGARLLGGARWAQERAIDYAKQRTTFGKPLSDRQAIQWMLAESQIDIENMRGLVYETARAIDDGGDPRREAAMVKCFAPLASARVVDNAIQIHGGIGLTEESGLPYLYAEARISRLAEGSTEVMKMIIARSLLKEGAGTA